MKGCENNIMNVLVCKNGDKNYCVFLANENLGNADANLYNRLKGQSPEYLRGLANGNISSALKTCRASDLIQKTAQRVLDELDNSR